MRKKKKKPRARKQSTNQNRMKNKTGLKREQFKKITNQTMNNKKNEQTKKKNKPKIESTKTRTKEIKKILNISFLLTFLVIIKCFVY